jgi:RHS repeat-associated protein
MSIDPPRRASRVVLPLLAFLLASLPAWAQNENETVGFQSNHALASGHFGENIDILNGGLHLDIPIGPTYLVNDRLSYQVSLSYNSKIWDYGDYRPDNLGTARPYNEGPFGIGFTLNLGRLLQDNHNRQCSDERDCWMRTWKWITSDGNQHDLWFKEDFLETQVAPDAAYYPLIATDGSYTELKAPGATCDEATEVGCFQLLTPNGVGYILAHHVSYLASLDTRVRNDNLSFGGWYVTRVFDQTKPLQNYLSVTYDTRPGFEHLIQRITDSRGRVITFHNCKYDISGGCEDLPTTSADVNPDGTYDRHPIATYAIDVPAFSGLDGDPPSEQVQPTRTSTFRFTYEYKTITRAHPSGPPNPPDPNNPFENGPVLELRKIDFPPYRHRNAPVGQELETYSIFLDYDPVGELSCRSLPIPSDAATDCLSARNVGPVFSYTYDYYYYLPLYIAGGGGRHPYSSNDCAGTTKFSIPDGIRQNGSPTRAITQKSLNIPASEGSGPQAHDWHYERSSTAGFTNPTKVTVTDPFGNDTIHYYHATVQSTRTTPSEDGRKPDDGLAPDWNDGLGYRTEYYRGTGSTRQLLRVEDQDYDTDIDQVAGDDGLLHHNKSNPRVRRSVTTYQDAGGEQTIVSSSDWDGFGNWRTVTESGFDVPGTRITRTHYFSPATLYLSGVYDYQEIHDGSKVLARTDQQYDSAGRVTTTISRKVLPPTIGSPAKMTLGPGDLKTTYQYNAADGSISGKVLSRADEDTGTEIAEYCIDYTWLLGAYLKTKTFKDCTTQQPLPWKAIDRQRDGNTGIIFATTDPAGVTTSYSYDSLGRITDVVPSGLELPTAIDYVSLRETTVTRGSDPDFEFSRYRYDGLGRLVKTEKRPAQPTGDYPYQTTCYDIANRVLFKSEWIDPSVTTGPDPCDPSVFPGTQFDYGTPPDPFGRIARVTPADSTPTFDTSTSTTYQGLSTTVTVKNVMGVGPQGGPGDVTTRYIRDGWGRLIMVDAPSQRRCDDWGALCSSDADCGAQHECRITSGADARYTYNLRDDLIQVDLKDSDTYRDQSRLFEYDALGRLFQSTNPESGTVVYHAYDSLGNVLSMTDASGQTLSYEYDPAGRLTRMTRPGSQMPLASYLYDGPGNAMGKLVSEYTYDDAEALVNRKTYDYGGLNGRLSSLTSIFPGWYGSTNPAVAYEYNNFGNVSQITYPSEGASGPAALRVAYVYANGYPLEVDDTTVGSAPLATITYNAAGGMKTLTTDGNVRTRIQTDMRYRPADITIGIWDQSQFVGQPYFESGSYSYDGAGNIQSIGPAPDGKTRVYRYDTANRLREAYEPYGGTTYMQCYAYDEFGNMIGKVDRTDPSGTTQCGTMASWDYTYTVTDQNSKLNTNRILNEQITGLGLAPFSYDAKGNLIKDWERRYSYDSRNRLVSLAKVSNYQDAGSLATALAGYDYDAGGNRLIKRDKVRDLNTYFVRGADGSTMTEFRRTALGDYAPEWARHHVYLAGREVALKENLIPSPPGGLRVRSSTRNGSSGTLTLEWRPNPSEEHVTSYSVWRSIWGGEMSLVGSAINPCSSDPSLICYSESVGTDTFYTYQVVAQSDNGVGYGSDMLWVFGGDKTAPDPPDCLSGSAADRKVSLTWTASPSTDVVGYNVYRKKSSAGGQAPKINAYPIPATTYVDEGLENEVTYKYWVKAVDVSGNESDNVVTTNCQSTPGVPPLTAMPKDTAPPAPPRSLEVAGDCEGGGTAVLTWDPNADTDGVTKYWVHRNPPFTPDTPKEVLSGSGERFEDTGLAPSIPYYYWVVAEDSHQNQSVASQKVGVQERATLLPVPPGHPIVTPGDGQVKVRFTLPSDTLEIASFIVYRKPNAEPSCAAYEQVGEVDNNGIGCFDASSGTCVFSSYGCSEEDSCVVWSAAVPYRDFVDATVPNDLAWDYVVASRDRNGNESGFSSAALAVPVGAPRNVQQCWERVPDDSNELDYTRQCSSYKVLHRITWDAPAGADPYHPITASSPAGRLSYLQGYHVRRYLESRYPVWLEDADTSVFSEREFTFTKSLDGRMKATLRCSGDIDRGCPLPLGAGDNSGCNPWEACVPTGACKMNQPIACTSDLDCVNGTTCARRCSGVLGNLCSAEIPCGQFETCLDPLCGMNDQPRCLQDLDCPVTASCVHDLYAPTDPYLFPGPGERLGNNEPIYYQGSNCVSLAAAYKVYADGNWQTVLSVPSSNMDTSNPMADFNVAVNRCREGTIDDPCGTTHLCPTVGQPPAILDPPLVSIPAPQERTIHVSWTPPTGPDASLIAGYYLYVREDTFYQAPPEFDPPTYNAPGASYGFARPQLFITKGPNETTHDFKDLSPYSRAGLYLQYRFQVASFDLNGKMSPLSPLSDPVNPPTNTVGPPIGLKVVIWTVNDASGDASKTRPGLELPDVPRNPRSYNGIKLQWKSTDWTGLRGFRVYRSEGAEGPYCVLTQGPDTTLNAPVCEPYAATAYSTDLTTSQLQSGNRWFFHDTTVDPGKVYYYKVTAVGDSTSTTTETDFSPRVEGIDLKKVPHPLSPPRHLKAWAPVDANYHPTAGVNLRWCPNPAQENVTGYKVYRSKTSGGPYELISVLTNTANKADDCLLGTRRCTINCPSPPCSQPPTPVPGPCGVGPEGTCKLVDLGVQYAEVGSSYAAQNNAIYYYVVTAVRGTEESAYSVENVGLPNYTNGPDYERRYDPDNWGDIACDDEISELHLIPDQPGQGGPPSRLASMGESGVHQASYASDSAARPAWGGTDGMILAPHRTIGQKRPSHGGGGSGYLPPPRARWLALHTDHLGSPRVVTTVVNSVVVVVSSHHYMPFGEEKPLLTRTSSNNARFTGHERDPESASYDNPDGLDYMLARYYSSSIGRFLRPDPLQFHNIVEKGRFLEDPQSWNKFSYALNNPIEFKDGTGRIVEFSPGYENEVRTNPEFRANHERFMRNPEGRRIYEKLNKSTTVFHVGVATAAGIKALAGKDAGGFTKPRPTPDPMGAPKDVDIKINSSPGQSDDQTIYHEFKHGENAIDSAGDPIATAISDFLLDEDPYGEKGMSLDMMYYNSFRPQSESITLGEGVQSFWGWSDAGLADYRQRNPQPPLPKP